MKFSIPLPEGRRTPQALLIVGLLLSGWLLFNQSTRQDIDDSATPHRPDFWANQFTTLALDVEGKPAYRLSAEKMVHFRDTGDSEFIQPDYVRFRDEQGPVTISAQNGWSNKDGTELVLVDQVVLVGQGDDPVTAEMDELLLYPDEDFAETSTPVKIISPTGTTTGIGMHVNSRTGKLVLLSNVRGIYESDRN
ncbi:MAG: LPS export ABC transporter periplasmic protein LptC [Gammaproteobacteria bacterium]